MVRVSLTEFICEQRFDIGEGASHVSISTKSLIGRENSKYKGSEMETCQVGLRRKNVRVAVVDGDDE